MIRLQSLSISNFRGIREGAIRGLTDVNVFVGRNNSGKTTVIEAMTRAALSGGLRQDLFGRDVEQLWQQARSAPGGLGVAGGTVQPLLWFRQDRSKDVIIEAELRASDGLPTSETIRYRVKANAQHAGEALFEPSAPSGPSALDPEARRAFCAGFTVFRPGDAFNAAIEQRFWPHLLSDRRDRALTQTLNEVFGLDAESFQLLPNAQFMVLFRDHSLPLDLQGDGTRAAMRTLMTLAMLRGTLLMLEEPESHQHPGSLERFAAALCRAARSQAVQLVVSTHSAECVRSFLAAAAAVQADAAVFHLTLTQGKQDVRRLGPEAVESLTNTGVDVRFLDLYA